MALIEKDSFGIAAAGAATGTEGGAGDGAATG